MLILPLMLAAFAPLTLQTQDIILDPPELLPLGGYTARHGQDMKAVGDSLHARIVIFRKGPVSLALASCEMLTIPESLAREVRRSIPSDTDLFLAATHTHCAPDSQMLNDRMTLQIPGIASYRPRWLKWYADRISKGIVSALHSKQTVVQELEVDLSHVDANRARRKFGDPDQSFSLLKSGAFAIFAEYAAHGTLYNESENVTRGDWPGELGSRLNIPVFVGAIGDVSPKAPGDSPGCRVQTLVDELLGSVAVQRIPIWQLNDALSVIHEPINLGAVTPHPGFAKAYGIPVSIAEKIVRTFAPPSASITAFRIGRLAVVGVPGEPSSHLGRSIRDYGRSIGFASVLVVSHVNAWMGYILGPEDYDRGGYEATLNFYGRDEGLAVVMAGRKALIRLRG